ncbi:MAG: monovalent cation/H(+) antiporter subunit G [Saezia sp.]
MNTTLLLPLWAQIMVSILLLISAIFALLGAFGLVRFKDFYMRMHPTAIVTTVGAWCTCIAVAICLTYQDKAVAWYVFMLIPLMMVTTPITTSLLARAALFHWRSEAHPAPPTLSYMIVHNNLAATKPKVEPHEVAKTEASPEIRSALNKMEQQDGSEHL